MSKPLRPNDRGALVSDLHRRLAAAGHRVDGVEEADGYFGPETTRSLLAFQTERGLDEHGLVDETTQAALVEAGLRLGDRHLYLHIPMFRGEDVADLQLRLGSLGFDAGRIDGIFGPDTAGALADFQRNTALAVDRIAGPQTIQVLRQLLGRPAGRTTVAQVRELDRLRQGSPELHGQRLAVGQFGSSAALSAALSRTLRARGAHLLDLDHPNEETQAATANEFQAVLYLGLRIETYSHSRISYFAIKEFQSEGGFRLAHQCASGLDRALLSADIPATECLGRRIPVLRQTRMPAVLCSLAPPSVVVLSTAEIADALAGAIARWIADPAADPTPPTAADA